MLSVLIGLLIPASKRISSVSSNANSGDIIFLLYYPTENALQRICIYYTTGNRVIGHCVCCVYIYVWYVLCSVLQMAVALTAKKKHIWNKHSMITKSSLGYFILKIFVFLFSVCSTHWFNLVIFKSALQKCWSNSPTFSSLNSTHLKEIDQPTTKLYFLHSSAFIAPKDSVTLCADWIPLVIL